MSLDSIEDSKEETRIPKQLTVVQLAARHTEIKDFNDRMASTAGHKTFSTYRKQRIYW